MVFVYEILVMCIILTCVEKIGKVGMETRKYMDTMWMVASLGSFDQRQKSLSAKQEGGGGQILTEKIN